MAYLRIAGCEVPVGPAADCRGFSGSATGRQWREWSVRVRPLTAEEAELARVGGMTVSIQVCDGDRLPHIAIELGDQSALLDAEPSEDE
jgi:hypothetical protein